MHEATCFKRPESYLATSERNQRAAVWRERNPQHALAPDARRGEERAAPPVPEREQGGLRQVHGREQLARAAREGERGHAGRVRAREHGQVAQRARVPDAHLGPSVPRSVNAGVDTSI